jgi:hypothetical protein
MAASDWEFVPVACPIGQSAMRPPILNHGLQRGWDDRGDEPVPQLRVPGRHRDATATPRSRREKMLRMQ